MTTSCVPNESLSVSSLTRSRVLRIEKVLIRKQERFVSRDIDFEAQSRSRRQHSYSFCFVAGRELADSLDDCLRLVRSQFAFLRESLSREHQRHGSGERPLATERVKH